MMMPKFTDFNKCLFKMMLLRIFSRYHRKYRASTAINTCNIRLVYTFNRCVNDYSCKKTKKTTQSEHTRHGYDEMFNSIKYVGRMGMAQIWVDIINR